MTAAILKFRSLKPPPNQSVDWMCDIRHVEAICIYAEAVAVAVKSGPLPKIDRAILLSFFDLLEAAESQK